MFESLDDVVSSKHTLRTTIEAAVARHSWQTVGAALLGCVAVITGVQAVLRYQQIEPGVDIALGAAASLVGLVAVTLIVVAWRKQATHWRERFEEFASKAEETVAATHDLVPTAVVLDRLGQGLYFDEARKALQVHEGMSPVDDFGLTRSFLRKFLKERHDALGVPCLSFQRMPQIDVMTTSQLQVVAMQVRLCMNVASKMHDVQHFAAHDIYARLHMAAVRNYMDAIQRDKKYAPNHYLGSRMGLNKQALEPLPGLIRILFWSRSELTAVHAQQFIDVWEAFGIPTFWIERSKDNCKRLLDFARSLGKDSPVMQLFNAGAHAHPDRWTREADFFTVGQCVVKGYGPDPSSSDLNWRNEGAEFAQFFGEIPKLCEGDIYYAKEASWRLSANGAAINAGKRHGFVLENDIFAFEKMRIVDEVRQAVERTSAGPSADAIPPTPA